MQVGKTEEDYLLRGIAFCEQRIKHYIKYESVPIPALKNVKNMSIDQQKRLEGELIIKNIPRNSF